VHEDAHSGEIRVTPELSIYEHELQFDFVRSPGPGGQKVNKVATGVQLRFDVANSPSLPERVRERLLRLEAGRITDEGVLVIHAHRTRSQARNRDDAVQRLIEAIRKAAVEPKRRHATKPPPEAKERRLEDKRRRGEKKRLRGTKYPDEM
jgi:ribosome-associated protein